MLNSLCKEGACRSASTSNTCSSIPLEMVTARLAATRLLPSPGSELVTMIDLIRLSAPMSRILERIFLKRSAPIESGSSKETNEGSIPVGEEVSPVCCP